jgi:hypothetical protein
MSRSTSRPFSSELYLKGLPRFVVPRIVPPRQNSYSIERELQRFLRPD